MFVLKKPLLIALFFSIGCVLTSLLVNPNVQAAALETAAAAENAVAVENAATLENTVVSQQASPNKQLLDISVQSLNGRIAASVTFSVPLKSDVDLDPWLAIETLAGDSVSGSWVLGDKAKTVYFTNVTPQTSYKVRVNAGLPLKDLTFLTQGDSQTLAIAAITPMLGFAGNGNLLASSLSDGLPVISVNAGKVEVDFFRIPQALLAAFLIENTRRGQQDFWQVREYLDKLEHIYTGHFDLNLAPNQTATSYLPVKHIPALETQGVYLAIMRKTGSYEYTHPSTWFAVSDLAVHLRLYRESAQVNVSSLATAKDKSGVSLQLLNSAGKVIAKALTDEGGNAVFAHSNIEQAKVLLATQGNQSAILRLFGPKLDLSEFPIDGVLNNPQQLFIYAPRDLYRPGEKLTISALLRDNDGRALPKQVLTFKLKQPDGRVVSEQRIRPNQLGYYASEWQIPKDAPTGQWSVSAAVVGQGATSYALQVEDFLPERMALTVSSAEFVTISEDLKVTVNGQYLYGAPAADNTLQTELVVHTAAHPFKGLADFYFSDPQRTAFNNREVLPDRQLNSAGELQLTAKNGWKKANTVLQLKLYSSLLDSGGRPVSRISTSYVLPAQELVGIRPLFEDDITPYDSRAKFEIILSDGQRKLAAQGLAVKLIRERRNYHWRYTEYEGWTSDYTERHYDVFNKKIDIKADGSTGVEVPVDWGYYRLEVSNPSTGVIAGYRFRAGWSADETVMAGRPDRIGLALNQQRYKTGDTLTLDIKPAAAGLGYLLVESDQVLYRQPLTVSAQGTSVSFTIPEHWNTHDIYISVLLVQPGAEREEQLPRRMMGIIHLPLERDSRQLEVVIDSPADIRPNSQLIVPITVTGAEGILNEPVQVTLAAVDVGVLNISKFQSPDPFAVFFAQRAYSVNARDSYADLISADKGVMAQLKFGGDEDTTNNGAADPDVEIVSLFTGVVTTDKEGKAQLRLDIPNFNGRLRLMAVAFSADRFGAADQDLQVASPVIAQLSKPRFLRAGDESALALDLTNLSDSDQQLAFSLNLGAGLRFKNQAQSKLHLSIKLAKNGKQVLRFPIVAQQQYQPVAIDLHLDNVVHQNETLSIAKHWQLEVKPAWAKSDRSWLHSLAPQQQFTLQGNELEDMLNYGLSAQLNASNVPPLDIASHLQALSAYPYGCLEQTTSGVFAQLYVTDSLLRQLGIEGSDSSHRKSAIDLAIQRLQSMQRSSGGFGLWSQRSPEEHWLSVYVGDFLLRAREAGYLVPEANLQKLLQRIGSYLRSPSKIHSYDGRIDSETKFAVRAYAGQVLARYNLAPLSVLRKMHDKQRRRANTKPESPMAVLQLSLALEMAGDKKRAKAGMAQALQNIDNFAQPYIYYASVLRDLALSSFWLLEADKDAQLWMPLLQALNAELAARQWLSTQERNALFLLGKELKLREGDAIKIKGEIAGLTLDNNLTQLRRSLDAHALRLPLSIVNNGADNLYLNLRASGYERQTPAAVNRQIAIKRRFYHLDGSVFKGGELASGEKLIVALEVKAQQRLAHAMIVDLLPAGLEIENQNLTDSYAQSELEIGGVSLSETMADLDIKHSEYRDDRFVMALNLARGNSTLYYLVRAVTPGKYQIPPTFAEDMYRPEIRHNGAAAGYITIVPR